MGFLPASLGFHTVSAASAQTCRTVTIVLISNGEREVGLSAIAAPVYNAKGKMIAAISISGPTARIIDEELAEKVQSVLECAGDISRQMGYFK